MGELKYLGKSSPSSQICIEITSKSGVHLQESHQTVCQLFQGQDTDSIASRRYEKVNKIGGQTDIWVGKKERFYSRDEICQRIYVSL